MEGTHFKDFTSEFNKEKNQKEKLYIVQNEISYLTTPNLITKRVLIQTQGDKARFMSTDELEKTLMNWLKKTCNEKEFNCRANRQSIVDRYLLVCMQ